MAWLVLAVACGHARAAPLPPESPPQKEPMQSRGVPADETHAPKPVDGQTMPPLNRVFDNVVFSILLPANTEVSQGWTGYFLADGKKIPNTDFKIEKVIGRGAKGSIAVDKLPAPDKLPSADVRLFSPRMEH